MSNVDAELRQVSRRNAGGISGSSRGALDFVLSEQSLENRRRGQSRITRSAGERNKCLCDGPDTVDQAQCLHNVSNLAVDGRVEDAVAGTNHCFMILEGIPGKRNARRKVVLIRRESSILGIELVTDTHIQCEIGRHGPLVLYEAGGKSTRIVVNGITESLLIELRES